MIEDKRTAQEKEIANLRASQEKGLEGLRSVIRDLSSQISALAANDKVNAGKLYGRKSEKSGRLNKRRDDDNRSSGKDNFDGTPGSDKGPASDKTATDSVDTSSPKRGSEDTVKALQRKLLRTHPGSESSAADNAFMYYVIESCRHNEIDPGKYVNFLLGKLKTSRNGEDLTGLLPCYCGL